MTNTELTKIREDRKLSKKEFADLLGVTAMMIGRYEKGTCAIPESIAEKLKEAEDKAVATEIEVKKNTRKAGRKCGDDGLEDREGQLSRYGPCEVPDTSGGYGRKLHLSGKLHTDH